MPTFPNLAACAMLMDQSGGARFPNEDAAHKAILSAIDKLGRGQVERAEDELLKFAAEYSPFGLPWAADGRNDEDEEPPISVELNAVLEAIYAGA